jgi:hypothetical protein
MNTWKAEDLDYNTRERDFMKVTRFLIPKVPGIDANIGKVFNLYRFLVSHIHMPAEQLAPRITEGGRPMFEVAELKQILNQLRKQKDTPYFKRIAAGSIQHGGQYIASVLDADPTRSKFWDKWIRKMTHTIGTYLPTTPFSDLCKNWDFYIYFLYSLEQVELIGPFVSAALDSVTLSLPVLSDLASTTVESIFVLLPVPYAAVIGQVLGYAIGTLFLLFALFMNINRKHFGSAFKVSLELIPMFGDILAEAAVNFELAMERGMVSRERMLGAVKDISPTMYSIADYYVPSVDIKNSAPPTNIFSRNTVDKIGQNLKTYTLTHLPIQPEKVEKASALASNIMNLGPIVVNTATSLLSGSIPDLKDVASVAVNKTVSKSLGAASAAANKAVSKAVSNVSDTISAATNKAVSNSLSALGAVANKTSLKHGGKRRHRRTLKRRRRS